MVRNVRLSQVIAAPPRPHPSQHLSRQHPPLAEDPVQLSQIDLSKEELDRLVAEVMRYMLFKNYQQPGVPIKREELAQLITKNYKTRNLPNFVIQKAQSRFISVFGYEMREVIRSRQPKSARGQNSSQGAAEVKSYVLKSTVPEELRMRFVDTKESSVASSLALVVVSIIHICGEKVPEETLWFHLNRLGIKPEDVRHPVFGDIKQNLEAIIKQRYIHKEKVPGHDGDTFTYELAEKALDSTVKTKIQSFIAQMVKKESPGLETPGRVC